MSTLNKGKINYVLQKTTPGTVLTKTWLVEQGVSKDLARKYVLSGWLERLGRGAYLRTGDTVDWQGALFSLQTQLKLTVHVAGLSALQLKGMAHYLPMNGSPCIQLFSDRVERLPSWFSETDWGTETEHRCVHLFNVERISLSDVEHKNFSIHISSPERAALEMIYSIKRNSDFEYTREIFAGLGALRPTEVQALLGACCSVRVKRIFLWMAGDCKHPWLKYVDLCNINLGSGNRVVYDGGTLDQKLRITVPRKEYGEMNINV